MKKKLIIAVSALTLLAPSAAVAAAPKVCDNPQSFWLLWLPKACNK